MRTTTFRQDREHRQLSGSANVEILCGQPAGSCEVECDDNLLEHLTTTVEDGELKIYFAKTVSASKSVQIWLSTEHLSKISVSGSVTGKVQGIDEPSTEFDISGSAKLQCVGKTGNLKMNVSGSADFECLELAADDVVISIAGSGNAKVQAIRTLKVSISGSGSIKYLGTPEIEKSIVGSGSVKPVEQ